MTADSGSMEGQGGAQIRTLGYQVTRQSGTQTGQYLAGDFRAVLQVGSSAHRTISALCGVLVHIFLIGLESGCHCNKTMVSHGYIDCLRSLSIMYRSISADQKGDHMLRY